MCMARAIHELKSNPRDSNCSRKIDPSEATLTMPCEGRACMYQELSHPVFCAHDIPSTQQTDLD